MKRDVSNLDPELEALLKRFRIERQIPRELRARVLARARAVVEGGVVPLAGSAEPLPMRPLRDRWVFRIALAVAVAVAGAAVGAVAALHSRNARVGKAPSSDGVAAAPRVAVPRVDSPASEPPPAATARVAVRPPHPAPVGAKVDRFTAELDLLQRAHGAYTRRDFSVALTLVAEHARRFPNGHLAEQREALRVRSLVGAGRPDEARRAADAFAVRFPRSVLLPRVAGDLESSPP